MSTGLKVVKLPETPDAASALRNLADNIEAGVFGDAHNVAWVIDCGDSRIEIGLVGKAAAPGAEFHLLLALGQRKIELGCLP